MRIYHIADIHIREKRFANLRHAFSTLFDAIRRDPQPKILVIAGDIFDAKYSTTLVDFNFFDEVMRWDVCPVLLIPGNHDMNINKLDAINCVTYACGSKNCVVASTPTLQKYGDIGIYLHPFGAPPMSRETPIAIAVVHATITGSTTGSQLLTGVAASDYAHFDAVLLGDIHKRQEVAPRMWYPGSFTQVAIDEGIDHGYLIWDTDLSRPPQYVAIPQPVVDVCLRFRNDAILDEIHIEPWQQVRRMVLKFYGCSRHFYEMTAAKYSELYPNVIETTDETRVRDMILDDRDMPQPVDINILDILIRNGDPSRHDAIRSLYSHYLRGFEDRGHRRFKLMYMEWSNLFCYSAKNYINFEDLGMVTSVVGPNGSGKTSIFKILNFALYRTVLGEKERYSTIVRCGATSGHVDICAMSGNDSVLLRLTATRNGNKQNRFDSKIYIQGHDRTGDTAASTESIKRSIYGAASIFKMINIIDGSNSFTESAAKKYKEALISLFGFGHIEDIIKEIKRDRDSIKKSSTELSGKMSYCDKIIRSTPKPDTESIVAATADTADSIKNIQQQISNILTFDENLLKIQIPNISYPLSFVEGDLTVLQKYKFPSDAKWQQHNFYPELGFELPKAEFEFIDEPLTHHQELYELDDFVPVDGHPLMTIEMSDELLLLSSLNLDVPEPQRPQEPDVKFLDLKNPEPVDPCSFCEPVPCVDPPSPVVAAEPQPVEINFASPPTLPKFAEFKFPKFIEGEYVSPLTPVSPPQSCVSAREYVSPLAPVRPPQLHEFEFSFIAQEYVSQRVRLLPPSMVTVPDPPVGSHLSLEEKKLIDELKGLTPEVIDFIKSQNLNPECSSCARLISYSAYDQLMKRRREADVYSAQFIVYQKYLEDQKSFDAAQKKYDEYVQQEAAARSEFEREQKKKYDEVQLEQKRFNEYVQQEAAIRSKFEREQAELKKTYDEKYAAALSEHKKLIEAQKREFDVEQKNYNEENERMKKMHEEYMVATTTYREQKKKHKEQSVAYAKSVQYSKYQKYELYLEQKKNYEKDQSIKNEWINYEKLYSEYQIAENIKNKKLRRIELEKIKTYTTAYHKFQHNQAVHRNRRIIQSRLHGNMFHLAASLHHKQNEIRHSKQQTESLRYQLSHAMTKQIELNRQLALAERDRELIAAASSDLKKYSEEKAIQDSRIQEMEYFIKLLTPNSAAMNSIQFSFMQDIINRMNSLLRNYKIDMKVEQDADAKFILHHHNRSTPIAAASKGQTFIVDLIFRVAVIMSHVSPCMKFIILDENLECLDAGNRPKIWRLIQEVGIPFIIVSHSENIQAEIDTKINISQNSGGSISQIIHGRSKCVDVKKYILAPQATEEPRASAATVAATPGSAAADMVDEPEATAPKSATADIMEFYTIVNGEYVCNICGQKYKKRTAYMDKHIASKHG